MRFESAVLWQPVISVYVNTEDFRVRIVHIVYRFIRQAYNIRK